MRGSASGGMAGSGVAGSNSLRYYRPSLPPRTMHPCQTKPKPSAEPTVTFWGALRTVTGSMHPRGRLRPDAAPRLRPVPGPSGREPPPQRGVPVPPQDIDAVVLSHAHIDHCGNLPNLVRQGFRGPIYCTPATRALAAVMLGDAAKIQEEDAAYLNRKRDKGEPKIEPLYDGRDVYQTLLRFQAVQYDDAEGSRPRSGGDVRGRRAPARLGDDFAAHGRAGRRAASDVHGRPGSAGPADPARPVAGPAGRPAHQRKHLRRPHARAGRGDGGAAGRGGAADGGARRQGADPGVRGRPDADGGLLPAPADERRPAAGPADLRGQPDGSAGDRGVPVAPGMFQRADAALAVEPTPTCSARSGSGTSTKSTKASR